jgi:hypothetical protein
MSSGRCALLTLLVLAACGGKTPPATNDAGADLDAGAIDAADDVDAASPIDAGDPDGGGAAGYVRQPPVTIPPEPPALDLSRNPVDDQGRRILAESAGYHLVEREPDPLTALSSCTAMIVRCVDPAVRGRSLDACVISPARCATAQPWMEASCCASACVDRYEQLRTAGTAPIAAFRQAFYGRPSCAPGVEALLGGAP